MVILADGLVLFGRRLSIADQRELWAECRALADGQVPMYTPTVRGGRKMSVAMLCLGKHWNGMTYAYEDCRSDYDGLPAPPLGPPPPRCRRRSRRSHAPRRATRGSRCSRTSAS